SELQSQALRLRMVSVARVFDRFPRTVRDLTRELGKEVEFEVLGREIELDRVILDQLHEPLLHLLRNALDHGLESPAERTRLGKPPVGKLTLSARREREHVVVEVVDDGKGMDAEALRAKAVERGMLTSEEAALLTEAQVFLLVCAPGFSTVAQVTQLSGRGVGMDVVKTAVEAAGGTMEIVSELGKGTRFALHLPVTLAIIRVLLIRLGAEVYGMPLSNVQEAVSMEDVTLRTIGNREVTTIRDLVLPVLRTKKLLEVPEAPTNGGTPRVLVVEVGRQRVGMVVDGLLRQQEVVIKPLSSLVRQIRGFAGATILGDGRVVLVLDPATVLAHV
ncbi:MAG: chemotaxis protein CheA, partial [Armatimonadetes bacterium]|nr:chemotaxis protein CheA [Armatimonadota bacterium]